MSDVPSRHVATQPHRFVTKKLPPSSSTGRENYSEFTVVGKYVKTQPNFVKHVAMLRTDTELPSDSPVPVWHIAPPLVTGQESLASAKANPATANTDVLEDISVVCDISLTIGERNKMTTWRKKVDETEKRPQLRFQQYIVHPPMKWEKSEKGRKLFRRFSCVGYVLECYKSAGIALIDTNAVLPDVSEDEARKGYEELFRIESWPERKRAELGFKSRADLGIVGPEPWKIVLPGYVFHSLQRATPGTPRPAPYAPASVDEARFPTTDE